MPAAQIVEQPHCAGYGTIREVKEGAGCRSLQSDTSSNSCVQVGNTEKQSKNPTSKENCGLSTLKCFTDDKESVDSPAKEKVKEEFERGSSGNLSEL